MDVVPAADQAGWETNPFEMVERDGLLIGRGTGTIKDQVWLHSTQ